MELSAIIIDDERLARQELRRLLGDWLQITVVGEAADLAASVELIQTLKPDVVFLDIQLRGETGFDLFDMIEMKFKLVFVTAFDEFAIRAFEVNAIDYLLKPVNPERLAKTIDRLLQNDAKDVVGDRRLDYADRVFVTTGERSRFIKVESIKFVAAYGDYTLVHTADSRKHLVSKPLKEWEERLPGKEFVRIHRSTIVNLEFADRFETSLGRPARIFLRETAEPLQVSRRYASQLKNRFR